MLEKEPNRLGSILENIRNSPDLDTIVLITTPFINPNSLNTHDMHEVSEAALRRITELTG